MSRRNRIFLTIGLSLVGLLFIIGVAAVIIVQTDWFRNYVREKIIAVTEESTGGKVDIASFNFDWTHLRATITGFVLHGTEKTGQAPLFQAKTLTVEFRLLSGLKPGIDLRTLDVDTPQANVIVYPDGSTNVPAPKVKKQSDKSGLETVVDLAVKQFDLSNGSFAFAEQKMPLNAQGRNLRAQLFYNLATRAYEGRISLDPLLVGYQDNPPLKIHAELPITLARDRIDLKDAKITTPKSNLTVNASVENMKEPRTTARVNANLAVQEFAALANLDVAPQPSMLNADIAVAMDKDRITISTARLNLGRSQIEASGTLKDPAGQGNVQLNASLATGELSRLFRLSQHPEGMVQIAGNARVTGDFQTIALDPLKVGAFGGQFAGAVNLKDQRLLAVNGNLHNFDIRTLSQVLSGKPIGYDGIISGPVEVTADLKKPGTSSFIANARINIAPGRRGVPVSGRLVANYNGATDSVDVNNSFIALPNSRLDVSGSLGKRLDLKLVTRNFNDFKPVADVPVVLNRGAATFEGTVTGKLADPHIAGHLTATNFAVEGREFDRLSADLNAAANGASIRNAVIARGPMQMQATANVGLRKWKPENNQPLSANATIRDANVADLLALGGQADIPATGVLNANAQIGGTIGNPRGTATITAVNGKLYDQPYDRLQAQVNLSDQLVTLSNTSLTAGPSRIDLTASFQHPRDSMKTGHIQAHVASNEVQLAQFQQFVKQTPGLSGTANTNLDVSADLLQVKNQAEFKLLSVNGDFNVRNLSAEGQGYGNLAATMRTAGNTVTYRVNSNLAGSTIRVDGQTQLTPEYPTTASASIANLPIERMLTLAGRKDIPARGTLAGNARVSGTLTDLSGNADMTLANAVVYDEPIDRIHARVNLTPQAVDLPELEVRAGPSRIAMNANFTHPRGDFSEGQLRFQLADSTVQLGQLRTVQKYRPGLAGALRLAADGAATLKKTKTGQDFEIARLNANANTTGLAINGHNLGDAHLVAATQGDRLQFTLDSDFAKSQIHGKGEAQLRGDYPMTAQLTFANVTYGGLRPFVSASSGPPPEFDAVTDGRVDVSGPIKKTDELRGRLEITRLQASTASRPGEGSTPITLRNQGPIVVALDKSVVRIESAHITGPQTDINVTGTAPLQGPTPMNVAVNATTNLAILQQMSRNIYSAGAITLQATVRGTMAQPQLNGRMELKNASLNVIDVPNGVSNANGVIVFNGNSANIQALTAESGGGKINLGGFVGFGGGMLTYGLKANASDVRVRYPAGASVTTGANLTLSGTSDRSVLGGIVTVQSIAYSPRSDFGSMLSRTASPVQAPSAPSGPLNGMRLDIRIRTAPTLNVQTALAQNIQADADLHVRGTAASPGMTGRVNISEGELVFFGTKYTVNQGSISFYNPFNIQPVLNIDLETVAKGVDVVLTISGPIENMKLTYRSDPPLQFQELVGLLATGKTPTSDPTLLANEPPVPAQSFQQMGESALVSQAIANPISSRLQRVFGVNQLKIDPTFTSGSDLPQARLTLQQQVTNNVTFSYITNLTQANAQTIRIEWAVNEQWSAIATREENGRFGVDFFYKRKFR